jgi:hydroxypyruvate isomerase
VRFLANLGFLFAALPLTDRITAAAEAGFDGVEFHDQVQNDDPARIADLLAAAGLAAGSVNSGMGDSFGLAALPGQEGAFAADLARAHRAAEAIGASAIHIVAGRGATDAATYLANLRRALDLTDRLLLIEPISPAAVPGYHLHSLDQALAVQRGLASPRIRILFDWFHMAATLGPDGAAAALAAHRDRIGHVQLASWPDRAEPGADLVALAAGAGFATLGLEYRPAGPEAATLAALRAGALRRV